MPARWSLRSTLVALAALTLLPILGLAAWQANKAQTDRAALQDAGLVAAGDLVVARYGELIEASRRMLSAACTADPVRQSASTQPEPADVSRCEAYFVRVLGAAPAQYSVILVTDDQGVARCASQPTAVGISLADRDVFQKVRSAGGFSIGEQIASRIGPHTVIPVALPITSDGAFRGMCAVGITLKALADVAAIAPPMGSIGTAMIARDGATIGGDPAAMRRLPMPSRLAASITGDQSSFSDYGRDGLLYEFRLRPITGSALYAVTSAPIAEGIAAFAGSWAVLALTALALALVLLTVWLGADRWCVQPLRYIQTYAERVARGEEIKFAPPHSWSPEMASIGAGVSAMAEAIASREAELRAGLEQRDHMLREIHHRVKNNLQMISSLLNLQAGEIRSPRIRRFFGDAQNRVLTLSILHRHLYERSSWSLVDFQQFISDLVRQLSVGRRSAERQAPRYHIRAPIMAVGPDTAIPVGLIVTEAVSIALNHDFAGVASPEVRIEAIESDGQVELVIEDNGTGQDTGTLGPDGRGGFGLSLIRGLAMQLGGEAVISTKEGGGSRIAVTFPAPGADEAEDA
ncbi:sensor histidine kinase [Reyranella sp.]|uniref:sensor histidine kinase n=1 Tax=Reyranella sp. TaxID=1929291 RepID=UPI0012159EA0|nr:sensor histidine kinase [Reyranella sp.]TAJ87504.1 MAG: sensor histidine kinase [Reyranella sp.]